jgi:hypothetical protein
VGPKRGKGLKMEIISPRRGPASAGVRRHFPTSQYAASHQHSAAIDQTAIVYIIQR